ncbi:MAG: RraA family protein [Rhodospirillaceae bacterium]|nr:RraA family protein [Rhodospirillaceae bacterium]MEA4837984.1 RraA family protein [Rhodospirillaceae bacterium]
MPICKVSRNIVIPEVLPAAQREALQTISTPLISDNIDRLVGVVGLNKYNRQGKMVGTAFTVKTRPGDNLFVYHAMTLFRAGHVLVIDAGGDLNNAIMGEIMLGFFEKHGCAGIVINGAIRDSAAFEVSSVPCFARGISHRGPYKTGPGYLGVPVQIGGQVINHGDVVVGDEDGIVVFAAAEAEALIAKARAKHDIEQAMIAEVAAVDRPSWLYNELEKQGFELGA